MTTVQVVALAVVAACYVGISVLRSWRVLVVWLCAAALVAVGAISPAGALGAVDLNVLGMVVGTSVIARLFTASGVAAALARQISRRAPSARLAVLSVCFAAGFISSWVDNVATVLIVAPVALAIADGLDADPAPFVIALTLSANLRGAATLIGDAASMVLASHTGMTFNDFFWFHGRPSLFFVVQAGGMAAVLVLQRVFRGLRGRRAVAPAFVAVESWVPAILLAGIVGVLSTAHLLHLRVPRLSALVCLGAAAAGLLHDYLRTAFRDGTAAARARVAGGLRGLDWRSVALIAGLFVVVGSLTSSGVTARLAEALDTLAGPSMAVAFPLVVVAAALLSGVVDTVPFVTAFVPVVSALGRAVGTGPRDQTVLLFGLLVGGMVGGNMVPIGSSTSIAALGMLERRGRRVGAAEFMGIGVPYTVVATAAASAFIWVFWRLIP